MHPLHYNLVIFKWSEQDRPHYKNGHFTFQSGYIQMYVLTPVKVLENLFTFQSGYIQILDSLSLPSTKTIFTFQSGYIQILCKAI